MIFTNFPVIKLDTKTSIMFKLSKETQRKLRLDIKTEERESRRETRSFRERKLKTVEWNFYIISRRITFIGKFKALIPRKPYSRAQYESETQSVRNFYKSSSGIYPV